MTLLNNGVNRWDRFYAKGRKTDNKKKISVDYTFVKGQFWITLLFLFSPRYCNFIVFIVQFLKMKNKNIAFQNLNKKTSLILFLISGSCYV